ncbi:hypoxanthine phosphoribosyltransferase [Candidatus Parcubacteria bacterium]|nr:hypoxanthine phosphoribosyltransferase [Candidatus Parcubacteria bacterium]
MVVTSFAQGRTLCIRRECCLARRRFKIARALAQEISRDYEGKSVVLVGLLKGAFMFLRDLGVALERIRGEGRGVHEVYIEFLSVGSYGGGHESGTLKLDLDIRYAVRGKHVILVEDVADTCNTLAWVVEHLQKKEPASLRVCVLIEKSDAHRYLVALHYVGFARDRLPFLGGYGLDDDGARRCDLNIFEIPSKAPTAE